MKVDDNYFEVFFKGETSYTEIYNWVLAEILKPRNKALTKISEAPNEYIDPYPASQRM